MPVDLVIWSGADLVRAQNVMSHPTERRSNYSVGEEDAAKNAWT